VFNVARSYYEIPNLFNEATRQTSVQFPHQEYHDFGRAT
jgi:hypothetical protein